jgi:hypothetical protein
LHGEGESQTTPQKIIYHESHPKDDRFSYLSPRCSYAISKENYTALDEDLYDSGSESHSNSVTPRRFSTGSAMMQSSRKITELESRVKKIEATIQQLQLGDNTSQLPSPRELQTSLFRGAIEDEQHMQQPFMTPKQNREPRKLDPEDDLLLQQMSEKRGTPDASKKKFYSDFLRPPIVSPGLKKMAAELHAPDSAVKSKRPDSASSYYTSPTSNNYSSLKGTYFSPQ